MNKKLVKVILVFLGVTTFLSFASLEKSTAFAQSKNPFGLMIGAPHITLAQRITLVKDLGAVYFRPNSVFLDKWNGNCNECQAAISQGIGLILTIRNNGGLGQPSTPPTDYNVFRQTLGEILDKYPPELLVVENEENSAALFYDGTAQEYLQELSVACEVAHGKGIKCTNGGLVSMLVTGLVANHYLEQGDLAKAEEYLKRALSDEEYLQYQNIPEATKQEQLLKGKTLSAGYKASGADFVNFHWYNADTPALEEAVNFLESSTGLAAITNEVGQHNEDPQQVTDVMGKIVELNMPYAVWFSVDSSKAWALIDTNGNLRPNGEAFKQFIEGMFIKGDIDRDGDVDIFDYNFLVTDFGKTGQSPADLDKDGDVDIFDYNIVIENFGGGGEQANCTHYASPTGSGNGQSLSTPFQISNFWSVASPGKTLCLLDGTYRGDRSMIDPPDNLNGTAGSPITVRALNDGKVTIDGEDARRPVWLRFNDYFIVEGFNAHASSYHVIDLDREADHNIIRRVTGWDASHNDNAMVFSSCYNSDNLFEDIAGWGDGRKIFERCSDFRTTVRRCFFRWTTHSLAGGTYRLGLSFSYDSTDSLTENCIGTWDQIPESDNSGEDLAVFGFDRDAGGGHRAFGNIAYLLSGQKRLPYYFFFGPSDDRIDLAVNNIVSYTDILEKQEELVNIGMAPRFRYVNGQLTNEPLWPWPMNERIKAAMIESGYASKGGLDGKGGIDLMQVLSQISNGQLP